MIQAAVGDGSRWGVEIEYAFDGPQLLGTGGAIRNAAGRLGDAFLVMYGDSYLRCDFAAVERAFLDERPAGPDDRLPQRRPVRPQQRPLPRRPHRLL